MSFEGSHGLVTKVPKLTKSPKTWWMIGLPFGDFVAFGAFVIERVTGTSAIDR